MICLTLGFAHNFLLYWVAGLLAECHSVVTLIAIGHWLKQEHFLWHAEQNQTCCSTASLFPSWSVRGADSSSDVICKLAFLSTLPATSASPTTSIWVTLCALSSCFLRAEFSSLNSAICTRHSADRNVTVTTTLTGNYYLQCTVKRTKS